MQINSPICPSCFRGRRIEYTSWSTGEDDLEQISEESMKEESEEEPTGEMERITRGRGRGWGRGRRRGAKRGGRGRDRGQGRQPSSMDQSDHDEGLHRSRNVVCNAKPKCKYYNISIGWTTCQMWLFLPSLVPRLVLQFLLALTHWSCFLLFFMTLWLALLSPRRTSMPSCAWRVKESSQLGAEGDTSLPRLSHPNGAQS